MLDMRRSRGEGSIRLRKTRLWEARYTIDGHQHSLYGHSRKDVAARLAEALRTAHLVRHAPAQSVGTYLAYWLEAVTPSLAARTAQRYEGIVRRHLAPLDKVPLARLGPDRIQAMYASMRSPATVRYTHAVLHAALAQAVRWQLIPANPASAVRVPRVARKPIVALNPEQARAFLEAVDGDPLEPLYVLALTTGMRLGELLGLTWDRIGADALTIDRTLVRLKGWTLAEPKTSGSRRQVALPPLAVRALHRQRVIQAQQRLLAGQGWTDHGFVFTDPWGEPLTGHRITERHLRPLLARADLPPIHFHALRHTFATLQLALGTPAKVVSEALGHSTVQMTLDTYAHVLPTMQAEAAERLERMLGGVG
jgi:integrase